MPLGVQLFQIMSGRADDATGKGSIFCFSVQYNLPSGDKFTDYFLSLHVQIINFMEIVHEPYRIILKVPLLRQRCYHYL